jgi:hypothetical protein
MVLAHNLNAMMKRLALGGDWAAPRMKAMRFHPLPSRVVRHARRLIVRPVRHNSERFRAIADASQR